MSLVTVLKFQRSSHPGIFPFLFYIMVQTAEKEPLPVQMKQVALVVMDGCPPPVVVCAGKGITGNGSGSGSGSRG